MEGKDYTVKLNKSGTSHKKMHVVSRAIKGMRVLDAINFLSLQNTNATKEFTKLLKNALVNYPYEADKTQLVIAEIITSVGSKRSKSYHAKSRGRGFAVRLRGRSNTLLKIRPLI